MSTTQRKRGQPALLYKTIEVTDNRGNDVKVANIDPDSDDYVTPTSFKGWFIPQRSARAEVPGQVQIDVTRMGVDTDLPGIDLWSRIEWMGGQWDVVSPPAYHHGTRHTRHWTIDLRARP